MDAALKILIEQAISQEQLSHDFYERMARLVSHQETKETFQYLAQEEMGHKEFLQGCLTPGGCPLQGRAQDVHLAEQMEAPPISEDLSPKEALVIAMKREEVSYHFYQRLAGMQPPGENRDFLNKMAQVELGHKEKMEYLYNNVAFPEVW